MSSSTRKTEIEQRAVGVSFTDDKIVIQLVDGREVSAPLEFYPRLSKATPQQRLDLRLMGDGTGIHWNALDEDLSVDSIVMGRRSVNSRSGA